MAVDDYAESISHKSPAEQIELLKVSRGSLVASGRIAREQRDNLADQLNKEKAKVSFLSLVVRAALEWIGAQYGFIQGATYIFHALRRENNNEALEGDELDLLQDVLDPHGVVNLDDLENEAVQHEEHLARQIKRPRLSDPKPVEKFEAPVMPRSNNGSVRPQVQLNKDEAEALRHNIESRCFILTGKHMNAEEQRAYGARQMIHAVDDWEGRQTHDAPLPPYEGGD